ncbi:MAG: HEAT repeat domain-containing protein [Lentisphaerae bacterium]|nr:HEAT repeat domain-containing protein [Lentisphaerota bacterium]
MTTHAPPPLVAGFARTDITPSAPKGLNLFGMPRRVHGALGVLDRLCARACYLQSGRRTFLLIELDLCLIQHEFMHATLDVLADTGPVLDALVRATGVARKHIWLCATHCHSSVGEERATTRPAMIRVLNRYRARLERKLVALGRAAVRARQPVEFGHAQGPVTGVAANRRVKLSDGTVVTGWADGPSPPPGLRIVDRGPIDPQVGAVVFRTLDHRPLGAIVNYNSHIHLYPIRYFSSELAGAVARGLERRLPGLTAVYTNGADGNVSLCANLPPQPSDARQWNRLYRRERDRLSTALVDKVLELYRHMTFARDVRLQLSETTLAIPFGPGRHARERLTAVTLNDLALVGEVEEMFVEFALALKTQSPFASTFVIGLNGKRNFYFPTTLAVEEGGYETDTWIVPGSFERTTAAALRLLRQMHGTPAKPSSRNRRLAPRDEGAPRPTASASPRATGRSSAACRRLLRASLRQPEPFVRAEGARLLGELRDRGAVPALSAMLRRDRWYSKIAAIYALGDIGDPRSLPVLASIASDPRVFDFPGMYNHSMIRVAAAIAMLKLGDARGLRRIADLLRQPHLPALVELAAPILALPDTPQTRPLRSTITLDLLRQASGEFQSARHVRVLKALPLVAAPPARAMALTYLNHFSQCVRAAAAEALLAIDPPRARDELMRLWRRERAPFVQIALARLLRRPAWLKRIARHLVHADYFVRATAAEALASTGDAKWASAMIPLLADGHFYVRLCTVAALESMRVRLTAAQRERLRRDHHPRVRLQAAKYVASMT